MRVFGSLPNPPRRPVLPFFLFRYLAPPLDIGRPFAPLTDFRKRLTGG